MTLYVQFPIKYFILIFVMFDVYPWLDIIRYHYVFVNTKIVNTKIVSSILFYGIFYKICRHCICVVMLILS